MIPYMVALSLPADVKAPGEARRVVTDACAIGGCPQSLVDDALLLISEVVTNVVVHGGPIARLMIKTQDWGLHVDVSDDADLMPATPLSDLGAESGRGLRLLEACSSKWGVLRAEHGKTVWFELRLPPARPLRAVH